jgi:hypothetical protein
MNVLTTGEDPWVVNLTADYAVNLTFGSFNFQGTKKFDSAPTPYKLVVENAGKDPDGNIIILFREA